MQNSVPIGAPGEARPLTPIAGEPFPYPEIAIALAKLAVVGASIATFAWTIGMGSVFTSFATKNTLTSVERFRLLLAIVIGGAVPTAAGLATLVRGRAAVAPLTRFAAFVGPLAILGAVPSLLAYRYWHSSPLTFLCLLTIVGIAADRLMAAALEAIPPRIDVALHAEWNDLPAWLRNWAPFYVVCAGGVAYSIYFAHYTVMNHRHFGTGGFDLGIYDNLMYNALHGHPFRSPVLFGPAGGNNTASHAEFAMLLLVPFYALKPGPEFLLVVQAVLLGMASVPLYLFASTQMPKWSAAIVALAYLLYAPLHGANFYDFHWLPLAIFFHFWFYYGIATRRKWLIATMLPILFLIREDIAVGTAIVGAFLFFSGARVRFGMFLAVISVAWFVLDKFVIMPWAGSWWFADLYKDLVAEGEHGYGSVIKTILTNPVYFLSTLLKEDKVLYVLQLFAPLAFLPARRLWLLALASPGFFFTLMTTEYAPTLSIAFQYTTHWIPYLFAAVVVLLGIYTRSEGGAVKRRAAVFAMSTTLLAHSYVFGAVFQHDTFIGGFTHVRFASSDEDRKNLADLDSLIALIPPDASVAATEQECPHVSTRLTAYTLKDHNGDADFLLVNKSHLGLGASRQHLSEAFASSTYGLVKKAGDFYLFQKMATPTPGTDAARAELGVTKGAPSHD